MHVANTVYCTIEKVKKCKKNGLARHEAEDFPNWLEELKSVGGYEFAYSVNRTSTRLVE
jgi:hypothetical protein